MYIFNVSQKEIVTSEMKSLMFAINICKHKEEKVINTI